jgi:hypothetical protein
MLAAAAAASAASFAYIAAALPHVQLMLAFNSPRIYLTLLLLLLLLLHTMLPPCYNCK